VTTAKDKGEGVALPAERVTGVGGIFFRGRDPQALAAWYRDRLGVPLDPSGAFAPFVSAAPGEMTIWSVMPDDTEYFGSGGQSSMVNYRVRDLDAMLAQLEAAGVEIAPERQDAEYGRFAWIVDPEGNRIELWEPPSSPPGEPTGDA
jgi:predicted enzyme related to lactoylglutathione lyase